MQKEPEVFIQTFDDELKEAENWYQLLRQNELSWINANKNPEIEFNKLYTTEPFINIETLQKETANHALLTFCVIFLVIAWFGLGREYKKNPSTGKRISKFFLRTFIFFFIIIYWFSEIYPETKSIFILFFQYLKITIFAF